MQIMVIAKYSLSLLRTFLAREPPQTLLEAYNRPGFSWCEA